MQTRIIKVVDLGELTPFELTGHGRSGNVPLRTGLLVDKSVSVGPERQRPTVQLRRKDITVPVQRAVDQIRVTV